MDEIHGSCVETTYARDPQGYGKVKVDGKMVYHHRHVYICHHKLTPEEVEGKVVMHKCDNPPCINLNHLVLGTKKDNSRDMVAKGRAVGGCKAGNKLTAKLTPEQVQEIKRRCRDSFKDMATEFGVSATQIGKIVNGKSWING